MFDFIISWRYIYRYNISGNRPTCKYIFEMKNKKCRTKENEYMRQRLNSFFNESFKIFKIINSYVSFRRFCCEISHVKAYTCDYDIYI